LLVSNYSLSSNYISPEVHKKLKDVKNLIITGEYKKAENSLSKISAESNLERDIVEYFRGNIYFLEHRESLAMLSFSSLVYSYSLDNEMIEEIKKILIEIHFNRKEYWLAVQYIDEEKDDKKSNLIRYLAYKDNGDYEASLKYLMKTIEFDIKNVKLWKDFFYLQERVKSKENIDIKKLLSELTNLQEFQTLSLLFFKNGFIIEAVKILEKGLQSQMLLTKDKKRLVYFTKALNDKIYLEKVLKAIIKNSKDDYFKLELGKLFFEIGEFEEMTRLLKSIKSGKKHILLGDLYQTIGQFQKAKVEWLQGLNYLESVAEAQERLKKTAR
jgi:tetratricopeptide (TPR) repeat protein